MASGETLLAYDRLNKVFTPHRPIHLPEFLAGRIDLLHKVIDTVNTEGLHAVLYGERGIGKTSIARVVAYLVQEPERKDGRRAILVSCSSEDDYSSIWRKIFQEILVGQSQLGFTQYHALQVTGRLDVGQEITNPNDVRLFVQSLPNEVVFIIDEFDRVAKDSNLRRLMADTIKLFADANIRSTVVLVGVAESITELLSEHQSIARNLAQIFVNPMNLDELSEIIRKGFSTAGLEYESELDREIAELSQGYPHYTHLLGLWTGRVAVERGATLVGQQALDVAIPRALDNTTGSVRQEYEQAVQSSQPENLFRAVLLACAMANKDFLGRFAAIDLREPLRRILNRDYRTVAYQGHLAKFCELDRGPVLRRTGNRKRYRWQFINPQLIPYIRLQGIKDGLVKA